MYRLVQEESVSNLCGGHDVFEVQGNATVQQREDAGEHVLHLLRGQGLDEHAVQGVDVALDLLEVVDALLLLLLLLLPGQ